MSICDISMENPSGMLPVRFGGQAARGMICERFAVMPGRFCIDRFSVRRALPVTDLKTICASQLTRSREMMTKELSAGGRIETSCSRCNDVTGHVIVAMVGDTIVKVECQACGSVHKYREVRKPKLKSESSGVRKVRTGETRAESVSLARSEAAKKAAQTRAEQRARQEAEAVMIAWKSVIVSKGTDDARAYSMRDTYAVGEVLDHPTFGMGEVQSVTSPDKMEVLFKDGLKTLRCSA